MSLSANGVAGGDENEHTLLNWIGLDGGHVEGETSQV